MKNNLEFENFCFHQGDVQFFKIKELPDGLKKTKKQFIAESERSGSCHALFGNYDIYEYENGNFVVDVHEECILNHSLKAELLGEGVTMEKPIVLKKKDHRHTIVPKGRYITGIQDRFDPLENIKKRVID
jgi:hypothetical protein